MHCHKPFLESILPAPHCRDVRDNYPDVHESRAAGIGLYGAKITAIYLGVGMAAGRGVERCGNGVMMAGTSWMCGNSCMCSEGLCVASTNDVISVPC